MTKEDRRPAGGDVNDFHGDRGCVTHHNACDCREAYFAGLERALAAAQASLLLERDIPAELAEERSRADGWQARAESAAEDLDKAANQFEGLGAALNAARFAEKAERARAALSPPEGEKP